MVLATIIKLSVKLCLKGVESETNQRAAHDAHHRMLEYDTEWKEVLKTIPDGDQLVPVFAEIYDSNAASQTLWYVIDGDNFVHRVSAEHHMVATVPKHIYVDGTEVLRFWKDQASNQTLYVRGYGVQAQAKAKAFARITIAFSIGPETPVMMTTRQSSGWVPIYCFAPQYNMFIRGHDVDSDTPGPPEELGSLQCWLCALPWFIYTLIIVLPNMCSVCMYRACCRRRRMRSKVIDLRHYKHAYNNTAMPGWFGEKEPLLLNASGDTGSNSSGGGVPICTAPVLHHMGKGGAMSRQLVTPVQGIPYRQALS